jgi:hypothetical protein
LDNVNHYAARTGAVVKTMLLIKTACKLIVAVAACSFENV